MNLKNHIVLLLLIIFNFSCKPINAQDTLHTKASQTKNIQTIQPHFLKAGDSVAIVAPSGVLLNKTREINQAIALLKSWQLHPVVGDHVFNNYGHFAGTDEERAEDFQKALDNPNIKAIWCARGGYGSVRILDRLNYSKFQHKPKWLIGYSDITALHSQLHNKGYQSIHALMCTSLTEDLDSIKDNIQTFKDAVFGQPISYSFEGSPYNKTGAVIAPLIGGNLTMIHTMLGSETTLDTSGKILFIEDIGEYAYHIDRMLQSLKRAGYFNNLKGLIIGDISKVRKNTTEFGRSIEDIILDVVADYSFPVAFNVPAGHEDDNKAMILGATVALTVGKDESLLKFQ